MDFKEFTAGKDDDGRRFDRVLRIFLPDLKLNDIYKLIRKGLVKINQKKAKPDTHINQGDIISIADFLLNNHSALNKGSTPASLDNNSNNPKDSTNHSDPELNVIFENQHLLIIDKPYGISVHGSENNKKDYLAKEVSLYYEKHKKDTSNASLSFRPGPLHRLDRNTSGLLVFSMSLEGAKWFSAAIKNHTIQKKYYGLAEGKLDKTEMWEDKLADSTDTDEAFHTVTANQMGQTALTIAKPLACGKLENKAVTLVEYEIKTGRKHQIRAQSKLHGHPLAGDKAYGGHPCKSLKREYFLQAFCLNFPAENPLGLPPQVKMGLSPDFLQLLECCEIKNPGL